MKRDLPRLYKVPEVAECLHVSPKTVRKWAREGRLGCIRVSQRVILFEASDIESFERECRHGGAVISGPPVIERCPVTPKDCRVPVLRLEDVPAGCRVNDERC